MRKIRRREQVVSVYVCQNANEKEGGEKEHKINCSQ